MTKSGKTHRTVKNPTISARYLADFMAASEQAKRTIVRDCRFRSIGRVVQHKRAKGLISQYLSSPELDVTWLSEQSSALRDEIADDDFDRSVLDNNADFVDRFISREHRLILPPAEFEWTPDPVFVMLNGVKVNTDILFKMQRTTKTNKLRVGGGAIRYRKDKPLSEEIALWQSAFIFGYLNSTNQDDNIQSEEKLCITICAESGKPFPAPTDSTKRFNNMKAACATIAERWENIEPPPSSKF